MASLEDFLRSRAAGGLLHWAVQGEAARAFDLTVREVEVTALNLSILPLRYQRNQKTISTAQQLELMLSKVAIVGCGGLGGQEVEILARLGVGTLKVVDPDVFDEHNLNRQLLCTFATLGLPKVETAARRVAQINPVVRLIPVQKALDRTNGYEILRDIDAVVDGLDNLPSRLDLANLCKELSLPLVHGSIGGWYGQLSTQNPGDDTVQKLYGSNGRELGIEQTLGNPPFTPAAVAALQAAEVCKILLKQGNLLAKRLLFIDLLEMEMVKNEI
jgi:molybdopterin/thiamine biosynthesis adenylyltransferase